jgi:hypothetical protein
VAVALLLLCGGAVFWYAWQQDSDPPAEATGITKLLTLDGAESQTRLDLPEGTTLLYGMFYAEVDWTVAVQARFERAALAGFLAKNRLPAPVDGLRPVPGLVPLPPPVVLEPSGSAAATLSSPPPTPEAVPTPLPGPLLQDTADWHPERPTAVSGIGRHVQNGVARWIMFDLDNEQDVTVYILAAAEVPESRRTASPTPGATTTASRTAR